MTTSSVYYGTRVAMTITNLANLANSATAGWQSAIVDNRSTLALDYQVSVKFPMANTAKANDCAVYVYAIPWLYDGSAWVPGGDLGTTTALTGSEGTMTLGATYNLIPAKILTYTATNQTIDGQFNISAITGGLPAQGWSLAVINYSGAAIGASPVVQYVPLNVTSA
jgi:hypothetical protein